MTNIHGLLYTLIGSFLAGYSWYLDSRRGTTQLQIFFYVGLAFALFGIVKWMFVDRKKRTHRKKSIKAMRKHHAHLQFCGECGTRVSPSDQYCSHCGKPLS